MEKMMSALHPEMARLEGDSVDGPGGLAADFDGSFSGLGVELGSSTYNMSEALLALPVFKYEKLEHGFQYVLGAATSPATRMNEETLTYLNQGQSYEIKLKKLSDLGSMKGKQLKSIVRVCFHERRLQYMEVEQMEQWTQTHRGQRILNIDVPLSYGISSVKNLNINQIELVWDPMKDAGIFIQVNCISTEFTARKHGGEKGVPFRIQVDTFTYPAGSGGGGDGREDEPRHLHSASCQVKVFKPKGADRKHKTDKDKMVKRSPSEQEKYQPPYDCTVLTECQYDPSYSSSYNTTVLTPAAASPKAYSGAFQDVFNQNMRRKGSPGYNLSVPSSISGEAPWSPRQPSDFDESAYTSKALLSNANSDQVIEWLSANRFCDFRKIFNNFSGADLLRLSREDLIEICGLADGIRLNNSLQARHIRPKLTLFCCEKGAHVYHAIYMELLTQEELRCKCAQLFNVAASAIENLLLKGPSAIKVIITEEVIRNFKDRSRYVLELQKVPTNQFDIILGLPE